MTNSTKITFIIVIVAIIIIGGYILLSKPPTRVTSEPIKLGAIYTLSGVSSDIGQALQEGTEIALEEINKRGVKGRKLQIIYEDAPDQAAVATVNAAQKLVNIEKVKAILDMPYSGLGSIRSLIEENKVPVIDVIDSSDEIASFGDWIVGAGIYANGVGEEVAKFAKKELGINEAAVLVGKDEYLLAVTGGFENAFKKFGGEIVTREEFLVGATDFRTQLLKIKNSPAKAIFVGHLGEGGIVVKQATELGFKGVFLGSDTFSIADVKRAAGELLNDKTYFALWRNFDALTNQQKKFIERYKEKYKKEPSDYLFYHVLGYDGLMVLAEALKNSDLSSESIKKALYEIKDYEGLSGPITIDGTGINKDPKSAIVIYKNGEIVRYKK